MLSGDEEVREEQRISGVVCGGGGWKCASSVRAISS